MQPVGCEQAVEELNRDRAVSDCGRHALHGAVADIAGREDARHARLEQKLAAIERPGVVEAWSGRRSAPVKTKPCSSLSISGGSHPVRGRADHEEELVGVDRLLASFGSVTEHELLQPPVASASDDLGPSRTCRFGVASTSRTR
jgi:hypothetical protein